MNEQGEGIVDELIRYLDTNKRIYVLFGPNGNSSFREMTVEPRVVPQLIASVKFRLPTNGRFYRGDEFYAPNDRNKFRMDATATELDMLHYPPYTRFVLEYDVRGDYYPHWETEGATPEKVVIMCEHLKSPDAEVNKTLSGIGFKTFEYRSADVYVDERVIPKGWATNGVAAITDDYDNRVTSPHDKNVYALPLGFTSPNKWEPREAELNALSTMWMEIGALLQFCVAVHAKKGVTRSEVKSKPRRAMTIKGRRLGYTYHVLDIDHEYVEPAPLEGEYIPKGHHASPRFHMRRAHLRRLPDHTLENPHVTFVRQCAVGNLTRGVVEKDYRVKEFEPPQMCTVEEIQEIHRIGHEKFKEK
jgi:hypothetical protein